MTSLPDRSKEQEKGQGQSMIHTAACLIIGDEVLGGKVLFSSFGVFSDITLSQYPIV
jgi:hypothetical protein